MNRVPEKTLTLYERIQRERSLLVKQASVTSSREISDSNTDNPNSAGQKSIPSQIVRKEESKIESPVNPLKRVLCDTAGSDYEVQQEYQKIQKLIQEEKSQIAEIKNEGATETQCSLKSITTEQPSLESDTPPSQKTTPSPKQESIKKEEVFDVDDPFVDSSSVKKIHIYDFDNVLFKSPQCNEKIYDSLDLINSPEVIGSWWTNPSILSAVGEGWVVEKTKSWDNFWNEDIVELSELSYEDPEALSILLSSRNRKLFGQMIFEMLDSKGLRFDAVVFKEDFEPTVSFKTSFLQSLLHFYEDATSYNIYYHQNEEAESFDSLLATNKVYGVQVNLIHVPSEKVHLNPLYERELVGEFIQMHNKAYCKGIVPPGFVDASFFVKRSVHDTVYMLTMESKKLLLRHVIDKLPGFLPTDLSGVTFLADWIHMQTGRIKKGTFNIVGEEGTVVKFIVTHYGFINETAWALKLKSISSDYKVKTSMRVPTLFVAARNDRVPTSSIQYLGYTDKISNWISTVPFEIEAMVQVTSCFKVIKET